MAQHASRRENQALARVWFTAWQDGTCSVRVDGQVIGQLRTVSEGEFAFCLKGQDPIPVRAVTLHHAQAWVQRGIVKTILRGAWDVEPGEGER
ncbi:MAG TPA: hypothetical protein VG476_07580 [Acidimicrobiales bacterium]|nr:hypothetical protein [Acidimicrobiales bacterium]